MTDTRPINCRFRLRDEVKPYPKSSCEGCGLSITTGLGKQCKQGSKQPDPAPELSDPAMCLANQTWNEALKLAAIVAERRIQAERARSIPDAIRALIIS